MPINPKLVHVYKLSDAVAGRTEGAWVFQYHGESFLTDPDGANPEPFAWADQPHEEIDFALKTREEIAGCDADQSGQARAGPARRSDVPGTGRHVPRRADLVGSGRRALGAVRGERGPGPRRTSAARLTGL